jgi:protein involved in polysaccharide export with SLBB domain
MGRVTTPGIYSLNAPTTVIEAITRAGGLATSGFTGTTEELADLQHSFVMRDGKHLPVNFKRLIQEGDMAQNIYLEPDDFVFLPSASSAEVYVLGAVTQPRSVIFKDQITISSAVSTAGGWLPTGFPSEVVLVRGSLTEPHFAVVNLLDILKGRAPDVRLQPRDIIYVPEEPLGMLRKAGNLIIQTFVRTVAANEGMRAGGTVQKVGVNINVNP